MKFDQRQKSSSYELLLIKCYKNLPFEKSKRSIAQSSCGERERDRQTDNEIVRAKHEEKLEQCKMFWPEQKSNRQPRHSIDQ